MKLKLLSIILLFALVNISYAQDNKLEISELDLYINGKFDASLRNNSMSRVYIEPGDDIEFKFIIKNTFLNDTDIENIRLRIEIINITDEISVKEESKKFNLRDSESEDGSLKIKIPSFADEIAHAAYIYVNGTDDNKNLHELYWKVYLKIDDKEREVDIKTAKIDSSTVNAGNSVLLDILLFNDGEKTEKSVILTVENKDLNLNFKKEGITVEKNSRYSENITIDVNKEVKTGTYPLLIKAYYGEKHLDSMLTIDLDVVGEEPLGEEQQETEEEVVEGEEETIQNETIAETTTSSETPQTTPEIPILAIIIGLILLVIVVFLLILVIKKK